MKNSDKLSLFRSEDSTASSGFCDIKKSGDMIMISEVDYINRGQDIHNLKQDFRQTYWHTIEGGVITHAGSDKVYLKYTHHDGVKDRVDDGVSIIHYY